MTRQRCVLALCAALAACGSDPSSSNGSPNDTTSSGTGLDGGGPDGGPDAEAPDGSGSSPQALDARFFEPGLQPDDVFHLANPDEARFDTTALADLMIEAEIEGSDAVLVADGDTIIAEKYFSGSDAPRTIQSVTKSVVSLAIGKLIEDGKIASVDDPLSTWYPEWETGEKAGVTLRHVLTHTSGITDEDSDLFSAAVTDKLAYARERELANEPGTVFSYTNIGTMLLSGIIAQAAGTEADVYVAEEFFGPLGITNWTWTKDPVGHTMTPGGLFMAPRDLLRLALFAANRGAWANEDILDADWIDASAEEQTPSSRCYGFLWWLIRDGCGEDGPTSDEFGPIVGFHATGWGGNYVVVVPPGLIAVRTKEPVPDQSLDDEKLTAFPQFSDRIAALPR